MCSRSLSPFSDEVLYQVSGYTQPWHEQRAGSAEAGLSLPFLLTLFYFDNVSCIMANNNYCILFGFGDPTTKPFTISRRLVPRTLLTWRTTTRLLTDFPTTPTVSRGAPSPLLSRDQTAFSLPSPLRILPSYCFQPRVSSGQHNPLLTYLIQVSRDPTALTRMDSECRGREGGLSLPYLRLLIT